MKKTILRVLALVCISAAAFAQSTDYTGDVKDVRVVRTMEQHSGASLVWEPPCVRRVWTSLRYKLQPMPGGAWSEERTFYDSGTHNSYPTLIEVAPGDFRAVWDSGTKERARTQIHFGKFHLP